MIFSTKISLPPFIYNLEHLVEAETIRFDEVPERADERQSTRSGHLRERFQMRR